MARPHLEAQMISELEIIFNSTHDGIIAKDLTEIGRLTSDRREAQQIIRNLEAVHEGQYRKDLHYRLNVIPVDIPALRDHPQDIPLLIQHLIRRINQEYGRAVQRVSPAAQFSARIGGYLQGIACRSLRAAVGCVVKRASLAVGVGPDVPF